MSNETKFTKEEVKTFLDKYRNLIGAKNYEELFRLCEEEKSKTGWLGRDYIKKIINLFASADIDYLSFMKTIPPAFFQKSDISQITIPANITEIGAQAFSDCENLKEIVLNPGLRIINKDAFSRTAIVRIAIPDTVEKINVAAFRNCEKLAEVKLPKNPKFTTIPSRLFFENTSLKTLHLPEQVSEVGLFAFRGCPDDMDIFIKTKQRITACSEDIEWLRQRMTRVP